MRPEDLVLFCAALILCYKPLKECTRLAPQLADIRAAYQSLLALEKMERASNAHVWTAEPRILIDNLTFSYQSKEEVPVFKALSQEIRLNKPMRLKGTNGAGKTTLLRLFAGLEIPVSGQLMMPESARRGMFYLSQRLVLPPVSWLTELIEQKAWGPATENFFRVLNLRILLNKQGHSGGEMQRLGLGWAVASGASLLFLDEPLAFIAQNQRLVILQGLLEATRETGQWWIMSSHELPPDGPLQSQLALWELLP
jgi:ABC-type multidrug transport system ATPase subunit